jgi:hypothetical protein
MRQARHRVADLPDFAQFLAAILAAHRRFALTGDGYFNRTT